MGTYGEHQLVKFLGNPLDFFLVIYQGPPPGPLMTRDTSPAIPPIGTLASAIVRSSDKLFSIAFCSSCPTFPEWCLVCVAFQDSTELHPACLQDGHFLVEFYIVHSSDAHYNGVNQCY